MGLSLHGVNPHPGHELLYLGGVNGSRKQGRDVRRRGSTPSRAASKSGSP